MKTRAKTSFGPLAQETISNAPMPGTFLYQNLAHRVFFFSPNAVDSVRTGLANFTVREISEILDGDRDKISRSGKRVLANQKYRQAQPGDLTVLSIGVTRAHSKTVRITVK